METLENKNIIMSDPAIAPSKPKVDPGTEPSPTKPKINPWKPVKPQVSPRPKA